MNHARPVFVGMKPDKWQKERDLIENWVSGNEMRGLAKTHHYSVAVCVCAWNKFAEFKVVYFSVRTKKTPFAYSSIDTDSNVIAIKVLIDEKIIQY